MNDEAEQLYDLKLHHSCTLDCGTKIKRVVGGWIYTDVDERGNTESTTFVPFNDEVKPTPSQFWI